MVLVVVVLVVVLVVVVVLVLVVVTATTVGRTIAIVVLVVVVLVVVVPGFAMAVVALELLAATVATFRSGLSPKQETVHANVAIIKPPMIRANILIPSCGRSVSYEERLYARVYRDQCRRDRGYTEKWILRYQKT